MGITLSVPAGVMGSHSYCQSRSLQNPGQQTVCDMSRWTRSGGRGGRRSLLPRHGCPLVSPDLGTSTVCAFNHHNPHGHPDVHLASHSGQDPGQPACAESKLLCGPARHGHAAGKPARLLMKHLSASSSKNNRRHLTDPISYSKTI